jgi:hypothetical protein
LIIEQGVVIDNEFRDLRRIAMTTIKQLLVHGLD